LLSAVSIDADALISIGLKNDYGVRLSAELRSRTKVGEKESYGVKEEEWAYSVQAEN
jgi:hypothetical protein